MKWFLAGLAGAVIVAGALYVTGYIHPAIQSNSGSPISQEYGNATSSTAQGSSPSVTLIGSAGRTIYVTDIAASIVGAGGELSVLNGTTVIWQQQISASSTYQQSLTEAIQGSAGNNVSVTMTGSSTVSVSGYFIP